MSDLNVLIAVRSHLLNRQIVPHVHLALPPHAVFPLILIELEEMWSYNPACGGDGDQDIQGRVKFRVSIFSRLQSMGEIAPLSFQARQALEGIRLLLPDHKTAILRLLTCLVQKGAQETKDASLHRIDQVYEAIIRQERKINV